MIITNLNFAAMAAWKMTSPVLDLTFESGLNMSARMDWSVGREQEQWREVEGKMLTTRR